MKKNLHKTKEWKSIGTKNEIDQLIDAWIAKSIEFVRNMETDFCYEDRVHELIRRFQMMIPHFTKNKCGSDCICSKNQNKNFVIGDKK